MTRARSLFALVVLLALAPCARGDAPTKGHHVYEIDGLNVSEKAFSDFLGALGSRKDYVCHKTRGGGYCTYEAATALGKRYSIALLTNGDDVHNTAKAVVEDSWEIDGRPVTEQAFAAFEATLKNRKEGIMCAETRDGGFSTYSADAPSGDRYQVQHGSAGGRTRDSASREPR